MPTHRSPASFFSPDMLPEISLVYSAKTPLGFELDEFAKVAQRWVDDILTPVWGTPARIRPRRTVPKNAWALVFVDTERGASDDGWHDLTENNRPMARVFLKVLAEEDPPGNVTLAATHEICEMLVDPGLTLCTQRVGFGIYSIEVADPVEEEFRVLDGFQMTDFVHPAWYEPFHEPGSIKFDWLGRCKHPFHILPNGYASILRKGKWKDAPQSKAKRKRFLKEDRAGHRTMQRRRTGNLVKSTINTVPR